MLKIVERRISIGGRGRALVECPDCGKQWEVRSDYPKTVDRCKECDYKIRKGRNKKYENTWARHQYTKYVWRATNANRAFEFTEDEFYEITDQPCHYCGEINRIGIDRVDSSIDYTKENSVPCCPICNIMKMDMEYDVFLSHIRRIARCH